MEKNGWRTAAKKPVLNKEIWQEIDSLYIKVKELHKIELRYVPGHSGFHGNEIVDLLARTLAEKGSWKMFHGSKEDWEKLRDLKL